MTFHVSMTCVWCGHRRDCTQLDIGWVCDACRHRAVCKLCDSTGEIVIGRLTPNPFSGVPVHDPQTEDVVLCPRCTRPFERPRKRLTTDELVKRLEASLPQPERRAA